MRFLTLSLALLGGAAFAQTTPKAPASEATKAPAAVPPKAGGGAPAAEKGAKADNVDLPETLAEILPVDFQDEPKKKKTASK